MPATTATPAVRLVFADNVTHVNRSTVYFSSGFEQVRFRHVGSATPSAPMIERATQLGDSRRHSRGLMIHILNIECRRTFQYQP